PKAWRVAGKSPQGKSRATIPFRPPREPPECHRQSESSSLGIRASAAPPRARLPAWRRVGCHREVFPPLVPGGPRWRAVSSQEQHLDCRTALASGRIRPLESSLHSLDHVPLQTHDGLLSRSYDVPVPVRGFSERGGDSPCPP